MWCSSVKRRRDFNDLITVVSSLDEAESRGDTWPSSWRRRGRRGDEASSFSSSGPVGRLSVTMEAVSSLFVKRCHGAQLNQSDLAELRTPGLREQRIVPACTCVHSHGGSLEPIQAALIPSSSRVFVSL